MTRTSGSVMIAPRPVSTPARGTPKMMSFGGPERAGGIGISPAWSALKARTPSERGLNFNFHQIREFGGPRLGTDVSPRLDKGAYTVPTFRPESVPVRPAQPEQPHAISFAKRIDTAEVRKHSRRTVRKRADSRRPETPRKMHAARAESIRKAPEITFTPAINSTTRAPEISARRVGAERRTVRQEVQRLVQEQQTSVNTQRPAESVVHTSPNTPVTNSQERTVAPSQIQHSESKSVQKLKLHESASWKQMALAKQIKAGTITETSEADTQTISNPGIVEMWVYNPATGRHDAYINITNAHFIALWHEHFMTPIKDRKAKTGMAIQQVLRGVTARLAHQNRIDGQIKKTIWEPEILPGQMVQPDTATAQPRLEPASQRITGTELGATITLQPASAVSAKTELAVATKNGVKTDTVTSLEVASQNRTVLGVYAGNIERAPAEEKNMEFLMVRRAILAGKQDGFGAPEKVEIKSDRETMRSRTRELTEAVNTVFPMWDPYAMMPMRLVGEALSHAGKKSSLLYQVGLAMLPDLADITWRNEIRGNEMLVTKGVALLIGMGKILFEYPAAIIKNSGQNLTRKKIRQIFVSESHDALGVAA